MTRRQFKRSLRRYFWHSDDYVYQDIVRLRTPPSKTSYKKSSRRERMAELQPRWETLLALRVLNSVYYGFPGLPRNQVCTARSPKAWRWRRLKAERLLLERAGYLPTIMF